MITSQNFAGLKGKNISYEMSYQNILKSSAAGFWALPLEISSSISNILCS